MNITRRLAGRVLLYVFAAVFLHKDSRAQADYQPDFSLNYKDFEARALLPKDEVWVVDFWASWCRPCIQSIPEMKTLGEKFTGKPVRLISISWDEDEHAWMNMLQRMKMPWQQINVKPKSRSEFLDQNFPHNFIPSLFLITRKGKVKKAADVGKLEKMIMKEIE